MQNNSHTVNIALTRSAVALLLTFCAIQPTYAQSSGFVLNLFAGVADMTTGLGAIVTPLGGGFGNEVDTLHGSTDSAEFIPGIGVGYDYVLPINPATGRSYFLHDVSLAVDVYNLNANREGQVYLFGVPAFGNFYNYNTTVSSWQVMLDSEWDFHPLYYGIMPFFQGGIGDAINTLSYQESPQAGVSPLGTLHLPNSTRSNFAYDLGAGVKVPVATHAQLSVRYLYSNLGSAETSSSALSQPFSESLHASSVLFGFTYLFGS